MHRLILLRHAKAGRQAPGGDRERGLEPRGRLDAELVGGYLAAHGLRPDLVVVSDARRTRETLELVSRAFPEPLRIVVEPRIYNAAHETLLSMLQQTGERVETLLAIGHNPGFAQMAMDLAGSGNAADIHRLAMKFPTAAFAVLDFSIDDWALANWGLARLERFVTPAMLKGQDDDEE